MVCYSDTIVYTAEEGCSEYTWEVIGGNIVSDSLNKLTVVWDIDSVECGWVKVTPSGCDSILCLSTTVKKVPIIMPNPVITGPAQGCDGNGYYDYRVTPIAGSIYTWQVDTASGNKGSFTMDTSKHGRLRINCTNFEGEYTVTVFVHHVFAGCDGSSFVTTTIYNYLEKIATIRDPCYEEDVQANIDPPGSYSTDWELIDPNGDIVVLNPSHTDNTDFIIFDKSLLTIPGSYTINAIIDGHVNCPVLKTFIVHPKVKNIMDITQPDPICAGIPYQYIANDVLGISGHIFWVAKSGCSVKPKIGKTVTVIWEPTNRMLGVYRKFKHCNSDTTWISPPLEDTIPPTISGPVDVCMDQMNIYTSDKGEALNWRLESEDYGALMNTNDSLEVEILWNISPLNGLPYLTATLHLEAVICGVTHFTQKEIHIYGGDIPVIEMDSILCRNQISTITVKVNGQNILADEFIWNMGDGTADTTTSTNTIDYAYANTGTYSVNVKVINPDDCVTPSTTQASVFVDKTLKPSITSNFSCLCRPICITREPEIDPPAPYDTCNCAKIIFTASKFRSGTGPYKWYVNGFYSRTTQTNQMIVHHINNTDWIDKEIQVEYIGSNCSARSDSFSLSECNDTQGQDCETDLEVTITKFEQNCSTIDFEGDIDSFPDAKDPVWSILDPYNTVPLVTTTGRSIEINFPSFLLNQTHTFTRPGNFALVLAAFGINSASPQDTDCIERAIRLIHVPVIPEYVYEMSCHGADSIEVKLHDRSEYIDSFDLSWTSDGTIFGIDNYDPVQIIAAGDSALICMNTVAGGNECKECIMVVVPPKLDVHFTTDQVVCGGSNITFIPDVSDHPVSSYAWNFGDGTFSTHKSPEHKYEQGTGTVMVSLVVSSKFGCVSTWDSTIIIMENDIVGDIKIDTSICTNLSELRFDPDSSVYTYLWSNGETSNTITVSNNDIYRVTVTDTIGCTIETDVFVSHLESYFYSDIIGPDTICAGDCPVAYEVLLSENINVPKWRINDGTDKAVRILKVNNCDSYGDSIIITVEVRKGSTVCNTLTKIVYIEPSESPDLQKEMVSCEPFTYRIYEKLGRTVLWDVSPPVDPSSELFFHGSKTIQGTLDSVSCSKNIFFSGWKPIDLDFFLTGCYDVCKEDVDDSNVYLFSDYSFNTWSYKDENGNVLLSGTGDLDTLIITSNMLDANGELKIFLEVTADYGGVECSKISEPFCLITKPCNDCGDIGADIELERKLLCAYPNDTHFWIEGTITPDAGFIFCPDAITFQDAEWYSPPTILKVTSEYVVRGIVRSSTITCADSLFGTAWLCPENDPNSPCPVPFSLGCIITTSDCEFDIYAAQCGGESTSSNLFMTVKVPVEWVVEDTLCNVGCIGETAIITLRDPNTMLPLNINNPDYDITLVKNQLFYSAIITIDSAEWANMPYCILITIEVNCGTSGNLYCGQVICGLNPWSDIQGYGALDVGGISSTCILTGSGGSDYEVEISYTGGDVNLNYEVLSSSYGDFIIDSVTPSKVYAQYHSDTPLLGLDATILTDHPELPGGGYSYCIKIDTLPTCSNQAFGAKSGGNQAHNDNQLLKQNANLYEMVKLQIVPNPVREEAIIKYSLTDRMNNQNNQIVITNINGQVIVEYNLNGLYKGDVTVNTEQWQSGMYNVMFYVAGTLQKTNRFVVMH